MDTFAKRLSVMAFGVAGLTLPLPDGVIAAGDRQALLGIPASVEVRPAAVTGNPRQVLCYTRDGNISTSATRYLDLVGGMQLAQASDTGALVIWPCSGFWRGLEITLSDAPGVGKSWTFTVMVDGIDTAMAVTISGTDTTARFVGSDLAFTANSRIRLKSVPSGTPDAFTSIRWSIVWESSTPNESGYAADASTLNVATGTFPVFGGGNYQFGAALGNKANVVAAAGSITGISVRYNSTVAAGTGYNFRIVKNGVLQDGSGGTIDTTCAGIENQQTTATFDLPVIGGDVVYLQSERVGSPGGVGLSVGITFLADVNGESQFCGCPDNPTTGTEEYASLRGADNDWIGTEGFEQLSVCGATAFGLKHLYVRQLVESGASASNTFTIRKNGASAGAQSVTISGAVALTGADTTNQFLLSEGDTFSLQRTESGGPASTDVSWGCIQVMALSDTPVNPPGVNPDPGDPTGSTHFVQVVINGTSYFAAEKTIRDPQDSWGGKKPATLKTISPYRRELSREGYRPSTGSVLIADPENLWRGFSATLTVEAAYIAVYRCSAPNGTIEGTPFRLQAGRIKPGGFTGREGYEFAIEFVDVLGEYFADAKNQPSFPTKKLTLAEFAGMDPDFDGKVAPKALGRLVEDGVGVVPAFYMGQVNPSTAFNAGGINALYHVLMITEGVTFSIPMIYINILTWSANTVIAQGLHVRPTPDSAAAGADYYFLATTGGTTGGTEPTWAATGTTSDGSVVWTVVGLDDPTTRIPVPASVYEAGTEFTHSRAANWETVTGLQTPYVDWIDGRRYTIGLLKSDSFYALPVQEGRIQPLFDVVGATTDAAASGPPILDPGYLITYILLNYVFADSLGTTDSVMPTLPGLDGETAYAVIDSESADAAKAVAELEMTGGYIMGFLAGASGEPDDVWDVIARMLRGGALEMGPNRHGQLTFSRRNNEAAAVISFNPQRDFTTATYKVDETRRGTRIEYRYGYRYADPFAPQQAPTPGQPQRAIGGLPTYGEWASGLQRLTATAAETALATNTGSARRKLIEHDNDVTRDATTANFVALRELDYGAGPSPSYHGTMLCEIDGPDDTLLMRLDEDGKTRELGDVFEITDPQGMSSTGYTSKRFRLLWLEHDPQKRRMRLGGEALDLSVVVVE